MAPVQAQRIICWLSTAQVSPPLGLVKVIDLGAGVEVGVGVGEGEGEGEGVGEGGGLLAQETTSSAGWLTEFSWEATVR